MKKKDIDGGNTMSREKGKEKEEHEMIEKLRIWFSSEERPRVI